jgi:hypothetical protein
MADSFDLDLFGQHTDDLHTPYVAGANVAITVNSDGTQDSSGWTLVSSDTSVISVTQALTSAGGAQVKAVGPGGATLRVVDASGKVLDSSNVSVAIPDQVSLYAEGPLLTGATDASAQVTTANVVAGGYATFLVRYFQQGTELYGSGALTTSSTNGLNATTVSASFATDRDFLQVGTPTIEGMTGSVALTVGGQVVGEIPITTVPASAVTHVEILAQSAAGASKGTTLTLYAHAVDATAANVYGASFDWSIDGVNAGGGGSALDAEDPTDLFTYQYDSSVSETVSASYDGFSPSIVAHGQGGSVGSSADVGCSVSGSPIPAPWSPAAATALALAGLAGAVRTSRSRSKKSAK